VADVAGATVRMGDCLAGLFGRARSVPGFVSLLSSPLSKAWFDGGQGTPRRVLPFVAKSSTSVMCSPIRGELRYLDSFEVTLRIGALNGVLKRGLWNQSAPYEARQNFTPESRRNQRLWSHIGAAAFRQGPYKPGY